MDAGVKARRIMLSVILILFSSFEDSEAGGIPSFCNIPPVKEGGNATVTCKFTEDIFVTKSDFEIGRYSSTNKQETLLVCTWNIDEPVCYQNPRIMFDGVITNTLQIQILNVTSVDAGKYICYVLPTPNGISNSCNLTLEETTFIFETHAPVYQMPRSSDPPMIDIWPTIQDSKEDGIMSVRVMGILLAVIIALIILQGICCSAAVLIYFKRGGTNDNDKEANKGQTRNIRETTHQKKRTQYRWISDINKQKMENENTPCVSQSTSEQQLLLSGIEQTNIEYVCNQRREELEPLIWRSANSNTLIRPDLEQSNKFRIILSPKLSPSSNDFLIASGKERRKKFRIILSPKLSPSSNDFLIASGKERRKDINTQKMENENTPIVSQSTSEQQLLLSGIEQTNCEYKTNRQIIERLSPKLRSSSDDFLIASGEEWRKIGYVCNQRSEGLVPLIWRSANSNTLIRPDLEQSNDINTQKMENENTPIVSQSTSEQQLLLSGIEQTNCEYKTNRQIIERLSPKLRSSSDYYLIASGEEWRKYDYKSNQKFRKILSPKLRASSDDFLITSGKERRKIGYVCNQRSEGLVPLMWRSANSNTLIRPDLEQSNYEYKTKRKIRERLSPKVRSSSDDFLIASGKEWRNDINTQKMENENTPCVSHSTSEQQLLLSGNEQTNCEYKTNRKIKERLSLKLRSSSDDFLIASGKEWRKAHYSKIHEKMEMSALRRRTLSSGCLHHPEIGEGKSEFAHERENMEMSSLTTSTSCNDISITSRITLRNERFRLVDCF